MSDFPALQHSLFEAMSRRIVVEQQILATLHTPSADARVAMLLLHLSSAFERRNQSPLRFRLPMSRGDIGNCLGLSTERVSRALGSFRAKTWIKISGRDVELLDPPALERLAGW